MSTSGTTVHTQLSIVWVLSFIEPDLFDNNVPFDIFSDQSALEIRVRIRVRLRVKVTLF